LRLKRKNSKIKPVIALRVVKKRGFKMSMKAIYIGIVIAIVVSFSFFTASLAQGAEEKSTEKKTVSTSTMKETQGEVVWVKKDKISVIFSRGPGGESEEEILLPIAKDAKFEHAKSISDIAVGDSVYIRFEELAASGPGGSSLSRTAKVIGLIKKGQKKTIPATTVESKMETLIEEGKILKSE
jgi:hypothetical protein